MLRGWKRNDEKRQWKESLPELQPEVSGPKINSRYSQINLYHAKSYGALNS